jgi:ribosomal protein S12 methylthiotransferase accessory factor
MSAIVAVMGEGNLADLVDEQLSSQYRIVRFAEFKTGIPDETKLALVLHDAWHPSKLAEAEAVFQSAGVPWMRGFISFGEGIIGPLVRPGVPGCSQCADSRRLMAGRDRQQTWMLQRRLSETEGLHRDAWASRTGLLQMTHLLVSESQRVLQSTRSHLENKVCILDMKTLKCTRHFFLPEPQCAVCGRLPDDTREAATITLQPNPKISEDSYRCRSLDDMEEALVDDYLDYRIGFVNGRMADIISPFADVTVNLPLFAQDELTAGRTHSYKNSELAAIMEGLERYCGMTPRGKRSVIRDSYHHLADQALNPVAVGLYSEEQYKQAGFPFQPFDPDQLIDWVWGYSFLHETPILVPQTLAYYSASCGSGFVYETSNGCALGGSLEEAIFYGIMEVVERDSFLMTWYAQLPLPRLDLFSAKDQELELMIHRLQSVAEFDLSVYNATMENGIPSIWALAKNRNSKGLNLLCAAGAHPDPVRAVKGALHELSGMMLTLGEKFEENREKYVQMLDDPTQVKEMDDHSMLYGLPQAQERLQFLLKENRPLRLFEEEFKRKTIHSDLTDDLRDVIHQFRRLNLDIIAVDQTTPELRRNSLHCVKVLIPGMLPMTFGYHLTRVTGLERVLRVPVELGYAKQPLHVKQLNSHPHPFP